MPRNITVTFADGTQHVYANAPDDVTPDAVSARAQQEFGKPITALDGGRADSVPKPAPSVAPAAPKKPAGPSLSPESQARLQEWQKLPKARIAAELNNAQTEFLRKMGLDKAPANSSMNSTVASDFERRRTRALSRFYQNPIAQDLRRALGFSPSRTKKEEIQDIARARLVAEGRKPEAKSGFFGGLDNFIDAAQAGANRMTFGLPERIVAGMDYARGRGGVQSYEDQLAIERAKTDIERGKSTTGNILGSIGGAVRGGGLVGGAVKAGGARLGAAASPVVSRVGNVLEGLNTLRKGKTVANAAKIVTAGAAGGGAQALGEGSDVGEGALYGAGGAAVLGGAVRGARGVAKVIRTGTRPYSSSVPKAIREVITEDPAAVANRLADLSARTGSDVPVVAALRDKDFKAVTDKVLKRSPEAVEIAKTQSGQYLRTFMNRMLGHVNTAGRTGNAQQTSIGELSQLRRDTADDLMRPIADRELDITQLPLDDLERSVTRQIGGRIQGLAPRINQALRDIHPDDLQGMGLDPSDIANARRIMSQYGFGQPVQATVKELDSLRRALDAAGKSSAASNPANSLAFRNAARTIRNFVGNEIPAYGQMVDTFAAQSRMMEGFETAASGQRLPDIADDTLRNNLRTPEGRVGMKAGELYRLREAASGKPTGAISLARDLAAQGRLTRPASLEPGAAQPGTVTENLGERPSAALADAAQAETQVLGRMLDTDKLNALAKNEEGALSPEDIVYGAFLGNALNSTKARFLATLLDKLPHGLNKKVANNLAEMLFSQDATQTAKAMRALQRTGMTENAITAMMRNSVPANVAIGALSAQRGSSEQPAVSPQVESTAPSVMADLGEIDAPAEIPEQAQETGAIEGLAEPGGYAVEDPNVPYGRAVISQIFPGIEITEDVRDPNSELGRKNPNSEHIKSQNAVDVRPIPGLAFADFIQRIQDAGFTVVEAIDEVNNPSKYATGPHWHVVIA